MRRALATLAISTCVSGTALAADTAADLYSQCSASERLSAAAATAPVLPGPHATLALMAQANCRELILRTWDKAIAIGLPLCPERGEVSDVQLELIFLDWVRRYPRYIGALPDEALYAAWENSFPCRLQ
jgi:hypothetical protein